MKKYFLHLNNNSVGPYSLEELRMMRIASSTPVWFEGLPGWKNAGEIPELRVLFFPGITSFTQTETRISFFGGSNGAKRILALVVAVVVFFGGLGFAFYTYYSVKKAKDEINAQRDRDYGRDNDADFSPPAIDADTDAPPSPQQDIVSNEKLAEFPGGQTALNQFIRNTIKYPVMAKEAGIQGTVYVQFTIDKEGWPTNPHVIRSASPLLDKEALRMIGKMPRWRPAELYGKKVNMTYTLPIRFTLQ